MRRRLLMILLGLGAIAGYGVGCAGCCHRHHARRAAFERHVADICVEAARRATPPPPGSETPPRK